MFEFLMNHPVLISTLLLVISIIGLIIFDHYWHKRLMKRLDKILDTKQPEDLDNEE